MVTSRLLLAAEAHALALPENGLLWLNAPGDGECGIAPDQLRASQTIFPEHARLSARGIDATPVADGQAEAALVSLHRAKAASLELIARALTLTKPGGMVAVDGNKTDGVESIAKALKARFDGVQSYSKAHGKLLWFPRPETLPDLSEWEDVTYLFPNGWVTRAGVFSSDGPDAGSKILAEALPPLKGHIADLGAGWGYLSGEVLKSDAVTALDGIEADYHAVACARHNVQDPRATIVWGDVREAQGTGYDVVVTNPPFHVSRKPDPALGIAFVTKAAAMLAPKGQLWMVANRNLPYETTLEACFRQVKTVTQEGGFKVIQATSPKNPRARN